MVSQLLTSIDSLDKEAHMNLEPHQSCFSDHEGDEEDVLLV